jgi:hypothetical protein
MNASSKIFLRVFVCLLIVSCAFAATYQVLAKSTNQPPATTSNQPKDIKSRFIHQLFADLTPKAKVSTVSTGNSLPESKAALSSSHTTCNTLTNEPSLHFANQRDALKYAMKKFSAAEIISIMDDITHPDQLTPKQIDDLKHMILSRFSQNELLALKEALDTGK